MTFPKEIKTKLKECPPEIQTLVKALQSENEKQAKKNAGLISRNMSYKSQISGLKKQIAVQVSIGV